MTQDIYRDLETPIVFSDSDGSAVITLTNLAAGAGRVSARYDRGAGAQPWIHAWRAVIPFETAPVVNEIVEIYLFESDGTYEDGDIGTADAALATAKRRNGKLIGIATVDMTSADTPVIAGGVCLISERYVSVGVWNGTADNLQNDANTARVILTPIPPQIQDAP